MKNRWKNIKEWIIDNLLFLVIGMISILFITSPIWMNFEYLAIIVSIFLLPLKKDGYKSSYIETMGALLGTFLAVSGALWTQRRIDSKKEKEKVRERTLIIYYDFKLVFDDVKNLMSEYQYNASVKGNSFITSQDREFFKEYSKGFKVHIDQDWITHVASVSKLFTNEEIKKIYEIYGDFTTIKKIYDKPIESILDSEIELAFHKMNTWINLTISLNTLATNVELKDEITNLLKGIEVIGGL